MSFSFFHVFAYVVCFSPRWLLVRAINNNEIREQTNYWVELIGRCCSIKCSLSAKMLAVELYRLETVCRHDEKCVSFKFDKQFLRVGEKEQQFRCFSFKEAKRTRIRDWRFNINLFGRDGFAFFTGTSRQQSNQLTLWIRCLLIYDGVYFYIFILRKSQLRSVESRITSIQYNVQRSANKREKKLRNY